MSFWVRFVCSVSVTASLLGGGILAAGFGAVMTAKPAVAQSANLIVVQGNRRIDASTIRSYFRTGPGERLDAIRLDEAYKALLSTGLFEDVEIRQAGGRIIVTVTEASIINRIAFEGNRAVKSEQLEQEIQSRARGPLSRVTVRNDVQRITDIYRANGRYDVSVVPQVIDRGNDRVDLVFEITEGRRTTIRSISFRGNRAFSAHRLRDVIKTGQTGLLSFLRSNDIYDGDRIEGDRELLRRFYLKNGYADVRIVSAVAEYDANTRGFTIVFTIDEGERYRFGAVEIISNVPEVSADRLRRHMRIRSGTVYDAEAVEKSVETMTIELARGGYPFAQIRPRGDRNFDQRTIELVFVVDQATRTYIERINVRGNTRTRDYVIRREFDIGEGDAYNHAMIERAERRLNNLGYFRSVKLATEPGSAPDRVIVNVDVVENSTGEFSVSGGYSTADGFMGEVSVAERNLLGRGQYARAAVSYGQRARGFELSFVEPYFLGHRLALGLDAFSKVQLQSQFQPYESRNTGGGFRFGFPLNDDVSVQLRYSIYQTELTISDLNNCFPANDDPFCRPLSPGFRKLANDGPALTSLVGYTLVYNTVDNLRNPTKGVITEFKQDFAGVGGDVNFVRSTFDARMYFNPLSDWVLMLRGQAGHITGWGGQELRSTDHFFMGPNLVRGFAPAGIGPRDITEDGTGAALGGTMYWGVSAELQHPLFFAPKDFGMRLAVFADAGSVWNYRGLTRYAGPGCTDADPTPDCVQTLAPRDNNVIRSSVGVGLIWDSPFGPLRFEYAYALTKDAGQLVSINGVDRRIGDQVQEFRFSGGSRF